jgi:hypothetical protein
MGTANIAKAKAAPRKAVFPKFIISFSLSSGGGLFPRPANLFCLPMGNIPYPGFSDLHLCIRTANLPRIYHRDLQDGNVSVC